jgi:hypothetical protein
MPSVFKKSITRYLDAEGRQVPKGTPGARKVREKSAKWYGRPPGATRPVPLCENKAAAQMMLAELVRKAEMAKAGVIDHYASPRKRPLAEHLADFRRELEAKGDEPRHVAVVVGRLTALLGGCGFVFTSDLSASRVSDWLAGLRTKGRDRHALDLAKESYTKRELAEALGVKPHCLPPLIRRWKLPGRGRAGPGASRVRRPRPCKNASAAGPASRRRTSTCPT